MANRMRLAVDGVLCISLRERYDRRQLLLAQFERLGLPVEFVLVDRDPGDPERGCYHSHQRCAAIAVDRGLRRVLILEDDATLERHDARQIARINRFLALRQPEIFYLGGILGRMWLIPFPGVVRCRLSGCHAYILSAKACRRLVATPWAGRPVDSVVPKLFRGYAAYPMLCQQRAEDDVPSDISGHRSELRPDAVALKDATFWHRNRARQHESVRKNWGRTLMMRWL